MLFDNDSVMEREEEKENNNEIALLSRVLSRE
jgi:hypothetical protein